MRKIMSSIAILAFALAAGCKQKPVVEEAMPEEKEVETELVGDCYLSVSGRDSILMHMVVENNTVTGHLHYRFYEKDKSGGNIFGLLRGDTLVADYKFTSEGLESEREVVFLRKGDAFVEGYGPSVEKEGRMVISDFSALKFTGLPLKKTDCGDLIRFFHN